MAVWVMKLNPKNGKNSFEFCYQEKIVGFGWSVEGSPKSIEEYRKFLDEQKLYAGDTGLTKAINAFEKVNKGDIIWTVDKRGLYYICRIDGEYQYSNEPKHKEADIVNYMHCSIFHKIDSPDLVPDYIIRALGVRGTIQSAKNDKAVELSELLIKYIDGLEKEKE